MQVHCGCTSNRYPTLPIIPLTCGVLGRVTICLIFLKPRPLKTRRCFCGVPMGLRRKVITNPFEATLAIFAAVIMHSPYLVRRPPHYDAS